MKKFLTTKSIAIIAIVVLLIGALIYINYSGTPAEKQEREITELLEDVSTHMLVPDERPVVATINQADTLIKEQPFYNGSKNGDKLIIFPKSQKAIIYSPTRDVIINSGPFVINSGTPNQ